MNMLTKLAISLILTAGLGSVAKADVKLPDLFSTNMALQADKPVNIWGWADPDEQVSIKIDSLSAETKAGKDGKWSMKLPAHAPGGPYVMTVKGKNELTIKNVVYGQVWLFSGQSNIDWRVRLSNNPKEEAAAAKFPDVRSFWVDAQATTEPLETCKGKWEVCSPETAGNFSAAAYYMSRKLHQDLGQPVGMIVSCVGNSRITLWLPMEALKTQEDFQIMMDRDKAFRASFAAQVENYPKALAAWKEMAATRPAAEKPTTQAAGTTTKPAGDPLPAKPMLPSGSPNTSNDVLSTRYNGMIAPLQNVTLAGITWYQGESNVDRGVQYFRLLPLLISIYRKQLEAPTLPFMVVQLPNMHGVDTKPVANAIWSEVRAAQAETAKNDPNVGLIVTIDVGNNPGEPPQIHPLNKQAVGDRLARKALAMVYGKDVIHSGPTFKSQTIEGDKVKIAFDNVGGGLVSTDGKPIRAFTIAGENNQQYWADAVIEGDTIVLSSRDVPKPVWVRYAWQNNPNVNLASKAGLPAAPFRTDTLLLSTRLNH
jgi:sialate O-acetylesterase